MRPRFCLLVLLLLCLSLPSLAQISPDRYLSHVKDLASDRFKGRGNDMPELQEAAKYMAAQFKACGLKPVNGSYFEPFRATVGTVLGQHNTLLLTVKDAVKSYASGADWTPLGISDPGNASGQVVFAGYGITADEYKYDDYARLDVKGKIVMVLRHEPQEQDEKSLFLGREFTRHAGIVEKAVNARMHGAVAMILVNDPLSHPDDGDPLMKIDSLMGPETLGLLAIQVKREVADAMLAAAGKKLEDLEAAIDKDLSNQSRELPAKLEMNVDVARNTRELQNVVGLLPGGDPALRDQIIVIGAHYDHLGLGQRNSLAPQLAGQIHYGADDNASGAAGVIELACDMAEHAQQLKRSVLFVSFAGEELGLLGSAAYTRSPLFPLDKTSTMINLDMIGRVKDRKIYIGGVGTAAEFRALLEAENKEVKLTLEFSSGGYGGSDHTSFTAKQVPVLFFFSGLHSDYHRPTDTWDKIDAKDAADVLRLAERVAMRLDAEPSPPQFVRVAEPSAPAGVGGGGYGAWFGSVPDFGEIENGVRFADIREGSPAAAAGLKAGDILVEFAGTPIKNLYDFTYVLQNHKPGEEVTVVVLRGEKKEKVTAQVKLGRRPE
jgi:hypothetical protein